MPNVIDIQYKQREEALSTVKKEKVKKVLTEYLKQLSNFEIEPKYLSLGLCDNFVEHWKKHNPGIQVNFTNANSSQCFSYWYSWTGSSIFPVPYKPAINDNAQDMYCFYADNSINMWDMTTSYGQMRYNFVHWLHNNIQAGNIEIIVNELESKDYRNKSVTYSIQFIWTNTEVEPFHET